MRKDASNPISTSTSALTFDERITNNTYRSTPRPPQSPTRQGSPSQEYASGPRYLIFFIPGNPGMISYYNEFLSSLSTRLNASSINSASCSIRGCSLGGFYTGVSPKPLGPSKTLDDVPTLPDGKSNGPFGLQAQIENIERQLEMAVQEVQEYALDSSEDDNHQRTRRKQDVRIVLMGHSVGAWLSMEVLKRHREHLTRSPPNKSAQPKFEIVGAVLLFPTIFEILRSPNGQRLGWLLFVPGLISLARLLVSALIFLLPPSWFERIVRTAMSHSDENGVGTTADFLQSRGGVYQALYMAQEEMQQIGVDSWTEDLWGVNATTITSDNNGTAENTQQPSPSLSSSTPATPLPRAKLCFYFGQEDEWVSNAIRDELIRKRKGTGWFGDERPSMDIEEDGSVKHSFCIGGHSELVAGKAKKYVDEVIEYDIRRRESVPMESGGDDELGNGTGAWSEGGT